MLTKCSNCGKEYNVGEEFVGKKVSCKDCGKVFIIEGLSNTTGQVNSNKSLVNKKEKSSDGDYVHDYGAPNQGIFHKFLGFVLAIQNVNKFYCLIGILTFSPSAFLIFYFRRGPFFTIVGSVIIGLVLGFLWFYLGGLIIYIFSILAGGKPKYETSCRISIFATAIQILGYFCIIVILIMMGLVYGYSSGIGYLILVVNRGSFIAATYFMCRSVIVVFKASTIRTIFIFIVLPFLIGFFRTLSSLKSISPTMGILEDTTVDLYGQKVFITMPEDWGVTNNISGYYKIYVESNGTRIPVLSISRLEKDSNTDIVESIKTIMSSIYPDFLYIDHQQVNNGILINYRLGEEANFVYVIDINDEYYINCEMDAFRMNLPMSYKNEDLGDICESIRLAY